MPKGTALPARRWQPMGKDVESTVFSREDRMRYRDKVRRCLDAFARMLAESPFEDGQGMSGLEIELNLVDADYDPALRNQRVLDALADPAFVTELGQFNIEINVPPQRLAGDGLAGVEGQGGGRLHPPGDQRP